jgi:hypothetical protein
MDFPSTSCPNFKSILLYTRSRTHNDLGPKTMSAATSAALILKDHSAAVGSYFNSVRTPGKKDICFGLLNAGEFSSEDLHANEILSYVDSTILNSIFLSGCRL